MKYPIENNKIEYPIENNSCIVIRRDNDKKNFSTLPQVSSDVRSQEQ